MIAVVSGLPEFRKSRLVVAARFVNFRHIGMRQWLFERDW